MGWSFHLPAAAAFVALGAIALIARPGDASRSSPDSDPTAAPSAATADVPLADAQPSDPLTIAAGDLVLARLHEPGAAIAHTPSPARAETHHPASDNGSLESFADDGIDDIDADWDTLTVARGQTLSGLFDRAELPPTEWMALLKAEHEEIGRLRRLREGDELRILRDGKRLVALELALDEFNTLHIERGENGFEAQTLTDEVETRKTYAVGEVASSLFLSGKRAGLSDNLIMSMVNILGYDIDFALDLRTGDRFTVIYEEMYRDGEKVRDGRILAVEFINRGRKVHAFRHEFDDGRVRFYRPDGEAVRTAFLRNPLDTFRISSHFNPNRRHPVLNTIRAHRGTDYAAPTGTPIRATGDGVVELAGNHGGYGRTVILRHGNRYRTLYAHMSRIGNGIRQGTRVRQGQVIGYVGMTGLATGPHLHYEFLVDGVHRNPLTVSLPRAEPLPAGQRPAFEANMQQYMAELERLRGVETAESD